MKVVIEESFRSIDPASWNALMGPQNPFTSHAFLLALEESKTAVPETGWRGHHILVHEADRLVAAAPTYLKTHSVGEFVFDYHWASAYHRAGGRYYPKLQTAVPYTPVPGPRLAGPQSGRILDFLVETVNGRRLSTAHITFCPESEYRTWAGDTWLGRTGIQFHWHNRGYSTFEDFLSALSARKRKAVKKERAEAQAEVEIEALSGTDLREAHWDAFFRFYMDTTSRKWGEPALTREFFSLLGERMPEQVVLFLAKRGGRYLAGALNLQGPDTLFGRNWGCTEYVPCLHFELCYYQAIEWAIARKFAKVEAGAQGMHKIARGYEPTPTYSLHYIRDPAFRAVLREHLAEEREAIREDHEEIERHTPFRKAGSA